jgi:drug/metabolite transporter (DMT)-like permease
MTHATIRGISLMLGSNLVFCIMACLVKTSTGCSAWMTTLFRFLLGIGIICFFAMSGRIRLNFVNSKGLFLRGAIGGISTAIFFYSITRIGLVRAGFIVGLYPAFATLL